MIRCIRNKQLFFRILMLIPVAFYFCFSSKSINAQSAPITTVESVVDAEPEAITVPIAVLVSCFTDIGQFTLTLRFDTTRIHFQSATPNSMLPGMTITYYPADGNTYGKIIFSWTGAGNVSLSDGSALSNLVFSYVTGTGRLTWAYTYGFVCQYKRYVDGSLINLNDNPKYLYYINGGISNRGAPMTTAPVIPAPPPGSLGITITASDFITIKALSLQMEYDPLVLTYQGTYTPNSAFGAALLVGNITGDNGKMRITIGWYGNPVTLDDGDTLCTLDFYYSMDTDTVSQLTWWDNGPSCEYEDATGDVLIDTPTGDYYFNGSVGDGYNDLLIDIIIQKKSNCGEFCVKLKPMFELQDTLTKIIFTLKWGATTGSDIYLKDILSQWPGLVQSSTRQLYDGSYYVTFSSETDYVVDWLAGNEYSIIDFRHSGNGDGTCDFTVIAADYSPEPPGENTGYYIEVGSVEATGNILNCANNASLNCGLYVKSFLQGPYDASTDLMRTDLLASNLLPTVQPYNTTPWQYSGSEEVSSLPAGVVDWVLVELRSDTTASSKVGSRVGLLKNDGSVIDTNGLSPLVFHSFIPGNSYYVVIYHRSHLPVMTANSITLPNSSVSKHDFTTNPSLNVYSTSSDAVFLLETGVYGQIAGDINYDNILKFSGPANDRELIFAKIAAIFTPPPVTLTSTIQGYYKEDLNLDGVVKYSGPQNDQDIIFLNIDSLTDPTLLNTVYRGQVPVNYDDD